MPVITIKNPIRLAVTIMLAVTLGFAGEWSALVGLFVGSSVWSFYPGY